MIEKNKAILLLLLSILNFGVLVFSLLQFLGQQNLLWFLVAGVQVSLAIYMGRKFSHIVEYL